MSLIKLAFLLVLPLIAACEQKPENTPATLVINPVVSEGPITPIPTDSKLDANVVKLGRALFTDPRLSRDNTISCAHCHPLDRYGTDGLPSSVGIEGRVGKLNAPTVYNSAFNFRQFWDGRAGSLEEQVDGPLTHPDEMDTTSLDILKKLYDDPKFRQLAQEAFGQPLDAKLARVALATFQRSLTTPDAPFDRFLRGDESALSPLAHEGWRLFREIGCISCHQGVNVGGNMYSRLGQFDTYFIHREPEIVDFGRYNLTGKEEDRFKFKVPSLRNVAKTPPYFHDGAVTTLPEAVERIARSQLGVRLSTTERDALVAFLESLTGQLPEQRH